MAMAKTALQARPGKPGSGAQPAAQTTWQLVPKAERPQQPGEPLPRRGTVLSVRDLGCDLLEELAQVSIIRIQKLLEVGDEQVTGTEGRLR